MGGTLLQSLTSSSLSFKINNLCDGSLVMRASSRYGRLWVQAQTPVLIFFPFPTTLRMEGKETFGRVIKLQ